MDDSGTKTPGGPPDGEPIDVYTVIAFMVDQLASLAWQKLGLQPDMVTGRLEKDLAQAKVAIDVTTHLSTFVEPNLDESDKARIHNLIRDLRMNWVHQSQEAGS